MVFTRVCKTCFLPILKFNLYSVITRINEFNIETLHIKWMYLWIYNIFLNNELWYFVIYSACVILIKCFTCSLLYSCSICIVCVIDNSISIVLAFLHSHYVLKIVILIRIYFIRNGKKNSNNLYASLLFWHVYSHITHVMYFSLPIFHDDNRNICRSMV